MTDEPAAGARCAVEVQSFPDMVEVPGTVHFQCRGKKMNFFMLALWVQIVFLFIHGWLSIGSVVWCFYFRSVSSLLQTIGISRSEWEPGIISTQEGEDFLFLFDLLAHSCGIESTLRVLTHSDDTFHEICKPNINFRDFLVLEEDRINISWKAADIERWLHLGRKRSRDQRSINLNSYELTIFPAESMRNTQTIPAKGNGHIDQNYSTWFCDLQGGKTEYVITIACLIGKSRMKGEKIVTTLVPYGPERPVTGMLKSAGTRQAEIFWDPPRGEFTKYTLVVDKILQESLVPEGMQGNTKCASLVSLSSISAVSRVFHVDEEHTRTMENLSNKLTTYTIMGLEPGSKYRVELGTLTGHVSTRNPIEDVILTRPLEVTGLFLRDTTSDSTVVQWIKLTGHPCLRGYKIEVFSNDGQLFKSVVVSKRVNFFQVTGMTPITSYEISISAICVYLEQSTQGDVKTVSMTTLPEPVKDLRMESNSPSSIHVAWEPGTMTMNPEVNMRFKVSISAVELEDLIQTTELTGDITQHTFNRLITSDAVTDCSGILYEIEVIAIVSTALDTEVASDPVSISAHTQPHRPTCFRVTDHDKHKIGWKASMTDSVNSYRVKWKTTTEDGGHIGEEATVVSLPLYEESLVEFTLDFLKPGLMYKVNIFAISEMKDKNGEQVFLESKELHEKVILRRDGKLALHHD